jgi:hypothetical protein
MDQPSPRIRANIVAEIARWWQTSVAAAEERGELPPNPDVSQVAVRFQCSEDEALRGLAAGEHLSSSE